MTFGEQVVWITGASSGIGEALAREMARLGARLVLSARREGELYRVKESCDRPHDHMVVPLDLMRLDGIEGVAQEVVRRAGHVDIFVHASGLSQRARADQTALDVDRQIMELNFFAAVALTKALLPAMLARGRGHLVPISSVSGKIGTPRRSTYAASKHALHGFFDSLRAEIHDRGLKVTIVCPGYVKTDISLKALSGDGSPHGVMDRRTEEGITAEQCAKAIARGLARGDEEVLVGGTETLGVYIKRFFPSLASYLVRRIQTT